jgi:hypothetical protein
VQRRKYSVGGYYLGSTSLRRLFLVCSGIDEDRATK